MGLDMYLYLRKSEYRYNRSWEGNAPENLYPEELAEFEKKANERNFAAVQTQTDFEIGYWRKFNALHSFIVENFAEGEDNCQEIHLDRADIMLIINALKAVKNDHAKAETLLPTATGFFFGGQEYDEYYFDCVDYALDIFEKANAFLDENLKKVRANPKTPVYELIYQASW